jgi:hypothetical protein
VGRLNYRHAFLLALMTVGVLLAYLILDVVFPNFWWYVRSLLPSEQYN